MSGSGYSAIGATKACKSLGPSGADWVGLPGGSWPWPYRIADEEMAKRVAITNRVLIARFVAIRGDSYMGYGADVTRRSTPMISLLLASVFRKNPETSFKASLCVASSSCAVM